MGRVRAMLAAMVCSAGTSAASPPPAAPETTAADARLLAGPRVPQRAGRTLVKLDERGRATAVEGRPDVAALNLLELTPDQREVVRAAAAARAAMIELALVEHLEDALSAVVARERGDRAEAERLVVSFRAHVEATPVRDPVLDAVAGSLPAEMMAEARQILDEYWKAITTPPPKGGRAPQRDMMAPADDAADDGGAMKSGAEMTEPPEPRGPVELSADPNDRLRKASDRVFMGEVREAYDRSLRQYRERVDAIERAVDPTPEQREMIRVTVADLIKRTKLSPTEEQRRGAIMEIYDKLDAERQRKLFQMVVAQLR